MSNIEKQKEDPHLKIANQEKTDLDIEDDYVIVDVPPVEEKTNQSYILQAALDKIESWKSASLNLAIIGNFPTTY